VGLRKLPWRAERLHPMLKTLLLSSRNDVALAGLRIAVGVLFLIFGEYKVFGSQFTLHGGFEGWINRFLQHGAYPFMAPVLRQFVLPHATAIAFLVAYGEFAHWPGAGPGTSGADGQRLRLHLHDDVTFFLELSRPARRTVAVLRRVARPLRAGALLSGFHRGRG
jgi:hypothetical protein